MMLNPPIALFDEEDRQRFHSGGVANEPPSQNKQAQADQPGNSEYYPDFLRENQQMTD